MCSMALANVDGRALSSVAGMPPATMAAVLLAIPVTGKPVWELTTWPVLW